MKTINKIMMIALFAVAHNGIEKAMGGNSATWAPQNFDISKKGHAGSISISTTNVDNLLTAVRGTQHKKSYLGVVARSSKKRQGIDILYNDEMQKNLRLRGVDLENSTVVYLGKISSDDATAIGNKLNAAFKDSDHNYKKNRYLFGIEYNPTIQPR